MLWGRMEKDHYSPYFFPNKNKNQDSERLFDLSNVGLKPSTSANSDTPQYSFLDERPKWNNSQEGW